MTSHPIDLAIIDNLAVAKADVRGYEKLRNRVAVANATEVRNTDFTGQFAGLHIRALIADFRLDPTDATSGDDGVSVIIDLAGNRFKKIVAAGGGGAPVLTQRVITAAGAVTLDGSEEDVIIIQKTVGAATTVNLPPAADRATPYRIVDGKGDAGTNIITIVPNGSEKIFSTQTSWTIDSNGSSVDLTPRADGTGWF